MAEGKILAAGEGQRLDIAGGHTEIKLTGDDTGGHYSLVEHTVAPRFPGPPPHMHRIYSQVFSIIEGTVTFRLGERTVHASAGSLVHVPVGVAHTFSNPGTSRQEYWRLILQAASKGTSKNLPPPCPQGPWWTARSLRMSRAGTTRNQPRRPRSRT